MSPLLELRAGACLFRLPSVVCEELLDVVFG